MFDDSTNQEIFKEIHSSNESRRTTMLHNLKTSVGLETSNFGDVTLLGYDIVLTTDGVDLFGDNSIGFHDNTDSDISKFVKDYAIKSGGINEVTAHSVYKVQLSPNLIETWNQWKQHRDAISETEDLPEDQKVALRYYVEEVLDSKVLEPRTSPASEISKAFSDSPLISGKVGYVRLSSGIDDWRTSASLLNNPTFVSESDYLFVIDIGQEFDLYPYIEDLVASAFDNLGQTAIDDLGLPEPRYLGLDSEKVLDSDEAKN